ncbi:MAG TPA: LLM class flavin-dependent oxidoreductase [Acidimicrobiales bacterium]
MSSIRFSVGLPPGPRTVEHALLAQELGYDRFWLFDSAALYQDIWVWLARVADRTEIKLGTAVLVPNLRHVMTTASAIATIEHLAPGRLACGFGTGATARWVLGKPALTWAQTRRYVEQLRALLNGEVVEVDGAKTQMIHHEDLAPRRPIRTPLLLSALGPKGKQIAREVADGIITIGGGVDDMDWHVQMTSGTVLDDGEDLESPRVKEALGPWFTIAYHGAWQSNPTAVDNLPLGAEWRAAIEAERPEDERHLAVHEGHASHVTPRDRKLVDQAGPLINMMGWAGTRDEIRAIAEAAIAAGATEILYTPAGPDIEREMRAWADALR